MLVQKTIFLRGFFSQPPCCVKLQNDFDIVSKDTAFSSSLTGFYTNIQRDDEIFSSLIAPLLSINADMSHTLLSQNCEPTLQPAKV